MTEEQKDTFGNPYNRYTQKYHRKEELFASGVKGSDSEWEASNKLHNHRRNEESRKREEEANQRRFEKYGSSGIGHSTQEELEKNGFYYLMQYLGLLTPIINFLVYGNLLYNIVTTREQVKPEKRKLLLYFSIAMVTPVIALVAPIYIYGDYLSPKAFYMIYLLLPFSAMLFNYLCEELKKD